MIVVLKNNKNDSMYNCFTLKGVELLPLTVYYGQKKWKNPDIEARGLQLRLPGMQPNPNLQLSFYFFFFSPSLTQAQCPRRGLDV